MLDAVIEDPSPEIEEGAMAYRGLSRIALAMAIALSFASRGLSRDAAAPKQQYAVDDKGVRRIQSLEERAALLGKFQSAINRNLRLLRTWQGKFESQDRRYYTADSAQDFVKAVGGDADKVTGAVLSVDNGVFAFAWDADADRIFVSYDQANPSRLVDLDSGVVVYEAPFAQQQRSVVTPEHFLHCDPHRVIGRLKRAPEILPREGPVGIREETAVAKKQRLAQVMDPRGLFECGIPIADFLDHALHALTEGEDRDGALTADEAEVSAKLINVWRLEPGDGRLLYRIQVGPLEERNIAVSQALTVDMAAGFNVVEMTVFEGSRLESQIDWKYEKQDGVFVPVYYRTMSSTPDGEYMAFQRILQLKDSAVNTQVSDSVFTYKSIGLTDGDRVEDRIRGRAFVLKNGALHEPQLDATYGPLEGSATNEWGWLMPSLNLLVVIILLAVYLRSWRRG